MKKNRVILYLLAIHTLWFCFGTNHYWPHYTLFFMPLFAIATVLAFKDNKIILWLLIAVIISAGVLSAIYRIRKDAYAKYLSDMQEIKYIVQSEPVYGNAEIAFELGQDQVMNDSSLGYFSGDKRKYIIVDERYKTMFNEYRKYRPELYGHITETMEGYEEIFRGYYYILYKKKMYPL